MPGRSNGDALSEAAAASTASRQLVRFERSFRAQLRLSGCTGSAHWSMAESGTAALTCRSSKGPLYTRLHLSLEPRAS